MPREITNELIYASEAYAIEKMCVSTTKRFGEGLTVWDPKMKKCRVTANGCNYKTPNNPFSQKPFDSQGYYYDAEKTVTDPALLNFWKGGWTPGFYVYKAVTGGHEPVCARGNMLLYQWCEFPSSRSEQGRGYTDVPAFKYTVRDNYKETCIIGEDYCKNRGLDYSNERNNEHCTISGLQQWYEFWMSEPLVRHIRQSS